MPGQFEIAITFIVYLLFFAWIGYRRGFRAELIVFLVALFSWIGLQLFGDVVVKMANLGGKFIVFATSGGLTASGDEAFDLLKQAPDIITDANRDSFLFVVWVIVVVITYVLTTPTRRQARGGGPLTAGLPADSRMRGWAVLIGMANGLLFASVFLPRLLALLAPQVVACCGIPEGAGPLQIFLTGMAVVFDTLQQLWHLFGPYGPWILLGLLTLFLLIAVGTLRGGSSSGGNGSTSTSS